MSISDSEQYDLLDQLAEEFAARFRRGERPSLAEYTDRYPKLAEEIRELFPALVEVEQVEDVRQGGEPGNPRAADLSLHRILREIGPGGNAGAYKTEPMSYGREIGDYRIVREIGRGGMGVVYEAEQISLGRRVALKVLPRQASGDRMVRERFRREARAAARLHHTNIVPVYEVGQDADVRFYAMQFILGQGLDAIITELRRLRDRMRSGPKITPAFDAQSLRPRAEHASQDIEGPIKGDGVELSPVLESIVRGRFDPGSSGPERAEASGPTLVRAWDGGRTTLTGTEMERCATDPDPALKRTEFDSAIAGEPVGPDRAHPRARAVSSSASPSSSSAILPGGTQLSSVESGHGALFRSLAQIGRQVAGGLAYAHARGIVHRDIKPSNLLLDTEGVVWITDFGLAKGDDEGLTQSGDILGTIRYMAPERFRGGGDARADVYALGLTLYEMLTLRSGFQSADRLELVEQIKTEEPPRPRSLYARIPRDLETIVLKAIEKEPDARYQTVEAMGEDLGRFLADEPIRARQVSSAERYWRWARRNPTIAVLVGVLTGVLVIATVCSLLAMERFRTQAETQRTLAAKEATGRRKADQANTSLLATQEELRRTVYATRSNLALAAWDAGDVRRLRSLLDLLRPSSGEPDLRGWEWRYLWQLAHEDRLALRGDEGRFTDPDRLALRSDEGRFTDAVFSPDGLTLAGLQGNGRIQLWDRHTGRSRRTIGVATRDVHSDLGPTSGAHALAFSPDGRRIAGPGPDASLVLYAVDTGLPIFRFEGDPRAILDLAWSPDGRTLVAALSAHTMRVWDARHGHLIHKRFGGHEAPVASVAFSADGRTLASAGYDHTVKLWSPDDPKSPRAVLKGHTDEVRAVAFSADGRRVCSAGLDGTIRVWDARSGTVLAVIRGHTSSVTSLAYLPGSARVVTGSADETVRVWDTASGQELRSFKGHAGAVAAVAASTDGRDIASASADATVRVWDAASPPRPLALQSPSVLGYAGTVECLAFSPDGRRLASGHDNGALRVWELPSGRLLQMIQGHTKTIGYVVFSFDGRTIASGGSDSTVRVWDAATGQPQITFTGHTAEIGGLLFTPDGQTVISGSFDRTIQAWEPATGVIRYVLRGHSDRIHDLALSPDGRTLASGSRDKTCILWDLPSVRPRATLRGHKGEVNSVAFSPDGQTLATSSDDRTVRLWDIAAGSTRGILEGHIDEVYALTFSPDGRLASSSRDKTIRLWDPANRQTLLILEGYMGRGEIIKFSPDGRTLASAGNDRTVKLWEAAPAAALAAP
jgi:WD40 repeat protein